MPANLLTTPSLQFMAADPVWRTFEPHWGDVCTPRRDPSGRFALKRHMPRGVQAAGGLYISQTRAGSLWETALRNVAPDDQGGVYLDLDWLGRSAIQQVRCVGEPALLRLEPGLRRHVIPFHDTAANDHIEQLCKTDIYEYTHVAAGLLQQQLAAAGMVLTGISWRSRMAPADIVAIVYEPPFKRADWVAIGAPVSLLSTEGRQIVHETLGEANMHWLNDPSIVPDPQAI